MKIYCLEFFVDRDISSEYYVLDVAQAFSPYLSPLSSTDKVNTISNVI